MRTRWKLAGLAILTVLAIVARLLMIPPVPTFEVKVEMMPGAAAPEPYVEIAAWIGRLLAAAVTVAVLGVLAWVTQHIFRRPREPDA